MIMEATAVLALAALPVGGKLGQCHVVLGRFESCIRKTGYLNPQPLEMKFHLAASVWYFSQHYQLQIQDAIRWCPRVNVKALGSSPTSGTGYRAMIDEMSAQIYT